ncbi:signal peptidase I [Phycicoccus sp. BSK3Z-2]|uniref:Signal peptidase I n=1 Tax=Phycicoccus avicenniae TaxID=2828860 RepID=A0A941I201_9MICO|nr:signal peptidase I [Phycicoccus avicenniae]MBR7744544.1 signal peptidase I [Phycicoccus avicenniae]
MTTWLSWAVTAVGALVLVVLVAVPRATGSTPYVVLTGSMEPAISPGDVVVVRPTPAEDLGVGSVVTYQLRSGRPEVVTHRVVGQGVADDGEVSLWTRGDANDATDREVVREVQVRGEVWYVVPWVGHVTTVLDRGLRRALTVAAALALFGYAAVMLRRGARTAAHRRRGRHREGVARP